MNIVIDTNVFISALIKKGITRKIITKSKENLLFPDFELQELHNHKSEIIRKSNLSEKQFYILLLRLLKYVKIIPIDTFIGFKDKAIEIIEHIDRDDVPFIAAALAFDASIWSDDKHFKQQKRIRTFTTKEMYDLL